MNRALSNNLLPVAREALIQSGIAQNGRVDKRLRSQISDFGAKVNNGSLLSAAALFNDQGSAKSERHKLVVALNYMLAQEIEGYGSLVAKKGEILFDTIVDNKDDAELQEKVLACAVALKKAMNLFDLKPEAQNSGEAREG